MDKNRKKEILVEDGGSNFLTMGSHVTNDFYRVIYHSALRGSKFVLLWSMYKLCNKVFSYLKTVCNYDGSIFLTPIKTQFRKLCRPVSDNFFCLCFVL